MLQVGGLITKLVELRSSGRLQQCVRCGLSYPGTDASCAHCGHLHGHEMIKFLEKLQEDRDDIANLGEFLLTCSVIVLLILMMIVAH